MKSRSKYLYLLWVAVVLACFQIKAAVSQDVGRPNVLFIAVDDLNDWVGYLGGIRRVTLQTSTPLLKRGLPSLTPIALLRYAVLRERR